MKKILMLFVVVFLFILGSCKDSSEDESTPIDEPKLELTVTEKDAKVILNDTSKYEFKYSANKICTFEITCDLPEGYVINKNMVTFSNEGVYTFTITAILNEEVDSDTVVVTVVKEVEPVITGYKKANDFDITEGLFYPTFTVVPEYADVKYTCDKEIEVIDGGIKFPTVGDYEIKITVNIGKYEDSVTINVHVYEIFNVNGNGTSNNPWQISNEKELAQISDVILNKDYDLKDRYFIQMADIDLSSFDNWTPIGTIGLPFEGIYDGNNYKISNLEINTEDSFQGLFGFITGVVKNVEVLGSIVVTTTNLPYSHSLVGGIVGGMNNGAQIINCINRVDITADASAGGIVGEIMETDYFLCGMVFSKVIDCVNYGTITANFSNAKNENTMYFGGIAGKNHGIIDGCTNYGVVDALSQVDETELSNDYVGGITGYSYQPFYSEFGPNEQMKYAAIINCENEANVSGVRAVGGIVGQHVLQVENCVNKGNIVGTKSVGGIAGITGTSGTSSIGYTDVINCRNYGDVTTSDCYAGGITGYSYDDIISCTNEGTISGVYGIGGITGQQFNTISECTNTGMIYGENCIGGISGISGTSDNRNATIKDSINNGTIEVSLRNAGGISGYSYAVISNCKNTANITPKSGSGTYYVGGIAGTKEDGIIAHCENSGNIKATATSNSVVGGIVGDNALGNIEDSINTGSVEGIKVIGGIVGRCKGSSYEIKNCSSSTGMISGETFIGGIVGRIEGTSTTTSITINTCENSSEVKGVTGYIGGIAGMHGSYNIVTSCVNNGKVSGKGYNDSENIGVGGISGQMFNLSKAINCTNNGEVIGERVTGGICGSTKPSSSTPFEIKDCTNNGKVTSNYSANKDAWVGGILGYGSNGTLNGNKNYIAVVNTNGAKYVNNIYGKISNVTTVNNSDLSKGE